MYYKNGYNFIISVGDLIKLRISMVFPFPTVQKYLKRAGIFDGIRTRDTRISNFDEIIQNHECIVVNGKLIQNKKRCDLRFSLGNLNGIKIIPKFDADLKRVFLIPNEYGHKLYHYSGYNVVGVGTYIPKNLRSQRSKILHKKILVYIPLSKFKLSRIDIILDPDAKEIAKRLLQLNWTLPKTRLTFVDQGDILIFDPNYKKFLIEISRSKGLKNKHETTYLVLGKILKTRVYGDKIGASTVVILNSILKKKLFKYFDSCVKYLKVHLFWTNFKENWVDNVINNLDDLSD